MENELPKRKVVRLIDYDYRKNGFYFITICTHNKAHLFGKIDGNTMVKSQFGVIAFDELKSIGEHHENAKVLNSVIMPNHIHIILSIDNCNDIEPEYNGSGKRLRGSVSTIIGSYKSAVSKAIHLFENSVTARSVNIDSTDSVTARSDPTRVWQTRFYEHVIRDEDNYYRIWQYIDENPQKWNDDCYF